MNIFIKKLALTNFKGIRSFTIDLQHETTIYGRNASGKTTLMDAFLWLFFGKDSSDRKDFEIKTLDENNKPYHNLDHEVLAIIDIDGQEISIRRVFREKWTKKKGSNTAEFSGHTTEFFWNEVPLKESEFQGKVAGIIDEKLFKLLTNVAYFNQLKWQERRNVLLSIAGTISDEDVLNNGGFDTEELKKAFAQGKTIEEFKREIAAKRKNIKDQLEIIPVRIQEANNSMPEETDYAAIEKAIAEAKDEIAGIETLLNSKSEALKQHQNQVMNWITMRQDLNRLMLDIEGNAKTEVAEASRQRLKNIQEYKIKLRSIADELSTTRSNYKSISTRITSLTQEQDEVRKAWHKINDEQLVFNDEEFCCPACKRAFESVDVEAKKQELTANFNQAKSKALAEKQQRGLELKQEIEALQVELSNKEAKGKELAENESKQAAYIHELEEQHTRLMADEANQIANYIASHAQYQQYKKDVAELQVKIDTPAPEQNNSALTVRKADLQKNIDAFNKQLASKEQRERIAARITELKGQEETMAQELSNLEGIEYSIEQFTIAKMDALEQRINGRFKMVRFQMFEEQVNGGRADACVTLVNSNGSFVPYADANTAAKIQAGLDIINTLSNHFGIKAPVWVDNRESVTELPETDCQLINLVVSPVHKKLTVGDLSQVMEAAEA